MFKRLGRRVNATTVIAVFALVFAMGGGAYAAGKYVINSKGQINPKVLKALKGNAGAKGAPGPAGPAGPAGPGGAGGAAGAAGASITGKEGPAGKEGSPGKEGKEGKEGTTGFTKTLPSGSTEEGTWSIAGTEEGKAPTAISFSIPLSEGLAGSGCAEEEEPCHVHVIEAGGEPTAECPGSVETPRAAKGELCVYIKALKGELNLETIGEPSGAPSSAGAGESGAVLWFNVRVAEPVFGWGTWAVTAN